MTRLPPEPSTLAGEAHVYLAATDEWMRDGELDRSLTLLSPTERRRHERFRVEAPARAFALGRILARRALSLYEETPPNAWLLEPDEHGRPRVERSGGTTKLELNLTHNDAVVACVVTTGIPCGIDVESLDRRVDPVRIAEHSFDPAEVEALRHLNGDDLRRRFYAYWTLKEAYLKARGRGIAMRLDTVVFGFREATTLEARFAETAEDRADAWHFTLFELPKRQLLALALRFGDGEPPVIRVYRALPADLRAETTEPRPVASSRPRQNAPA